MLFLKHFDKEKKREREIDRVKQKENEIEIYREINFEEFSRIFKSAATL